jgi:cytochrome c-type biogenesis protein CcmE
MTVQAGIPATPPRKRLTRKQRRLVVIASVGIVLGLAAGLVAYALRDSIVFFYGPTEIVEKGLAPGTRLRLGGLVETGSVERGANQRVSFAVTDGPMSSRTSRSAMSGRIRTR